MINCFLRRLAFACALAVCGASSAKDPPPILENSGTVQAAFSPWDDVEALIGMTLAGARRQILVQAYLLTSRKFSTALIAARRRGVEVLVLADARQHEAGDSPRLQELADAGVGVWLESAFQNAHNKVIVIDADSSAATVITGSYNFTWSAQHRNAENVVIIRGNTALARRYAANWARHRADASPFERN